MIDQLQPMTMDELHENDFLLLMKSQMCLMCVCVYKRVLLN